MRLISNLDWTSKLGLLGGCAALTFVTAIVAGVL